MSKYMYIALGGYMHILGAPSVQSCCTLWISIWIFVYGRYCKSRLVCVWLSDLDLLLLYAFRDLWKEWGDSNFQIFSQNCQFHHRRLESLDHFNVLLYIILSTTVSFLEDTFSFLCTFPFFTQVHVACVLCI